MIIKSITLNNFRQFKGEQHPILFSMDNIKNVTVILGVNTSGKTTLIQAFMWCLYEKSTFRTREVINVEVVRSMGLSSSQEVYVEIVLFHEDREFVIRRTKKFTKTDFDRVTDERSLLKIEYKEDNGEQQAIPPYECENTINKILPEALSDYFFFDGERIADINNRGDVVAAVRGLMGLDVVSEAKDRLDPSKASSVTSKFNNELDIGNDKRSSKLKSDLIDAQIKLEQYKKRREVVKEEIEFYERRKEELSAQIISHREEKDNQEKKILLEKDIEQIEKNIASFEVRIKNDFSKGALSYFAQPLVARSIGVIDSATLDGEGIPEMRSKAIDHILKRQRCICGLDLIKNEGARENILSEQRLLPPQHLGTILRTYKKTYIGYLREAKDYNTMTFENLKGYRSNINYLEEKIYKLKLVSAKIEGNINVAKLEQDYQENEVTLKEKRDQILRIVGNIGGVETEMGSLQKGIESLSVTSEKNKKLAKYIAYSKSVFEWFKVSYDKQEREVKDRLLESVNSIFDRMYHGKRIVTINDKYQIVLKTQLGNVAISTDESKGLETVKNFSFITGLVDLARQKAHKGNNDTDDINDSELSIYTEPYPLVMDAPFSNADEIHINNISKIIPEIAEQVILIVMKKDWEFAKFALEDKIGISYTIEKINNSDTNSVIRRTI